MEIMVCIKQVPDDSVKIELDEGTGKPAAGRAEPIVNAFDTYALEMAARFLETGIAGEITTITIGDESSKGSIKNCLAVGASHGYVINDELFEGSDAQGTAYALRCAVRKIEQDTGRDFDIVFCGIETSDETSGQTGPMLAEMLGCSLVTNVVALEEKDGVLHADRSNLRQPRDREYCGNRADGRALLPRKRCGTLCCAGDGKSRRGDCGGTACDTGKSGCYRGDSRM